MPSTLETDETLTEILELPNHKTAKKAITPRDGQSTDELREFQDGWEKPLDLLVRKNPYIYGDALFC